MNWEEVAEEGIFEGEGLEWLNVHDNGDELYLDFYIDDEEGNQSDNGDSIGLNREQVERLRIEPSYENFHQLRELVKSLPRYDRLEIIDLANEKLTSE